MGGRGEPWSTACSWWCCWGSLPQLEGRIPRAWAGCGAEAQLLQPGWALESATPLCVLCCRVKAQVLPALLLPTSTQTPWSQTWSVPAGTGVTWQRCHMGEVSPGTNVTWERCHLAEMSLGRVVTWLPCGQLGTINGDAVLMFVISCPAHYA